MDLPQTMSDEILVSIRGHGMWWSFKQVMSGLSNYYMVMSSQPQIAQHIIDSGLGKFQGKYMNLLQTISVVM